jgi:hypothetical protein
MIAVDLSNFLLFLQFLLILTIYFSQMPIKEYRFASKKDNFPHLLQGYPITFHYISEIHSSQWQEATGDHLGKTAGQCAIHVRILITSEKYQKGCQKAPMLTYIAGSVYLDLDM